MQKNEVEGWMKKMEELGRKPKGSGYTSRELIELSGVCEQRILVNLRKAIEAGLVEVVMEHRPNICGRITKVPTYVFKDKKDRK